METGLISEILFFRVLYCNRSARKSRLGKIKNENIKEIMGVKGKPDIIEKKILQWYGHVKRMLEERIPKLIVE
jgi:adenine-specific DNA methylase